MHKIVFSIDNPAEIRIFNHLTNKKVICQKSNNRIVHNPSTTLFSGFFLTVSPDSMIKVAEHAGNHGKHFAMNLSAPFLAQFFKDPMLKVRYSEKATKFEKQSPIFSHS